MCWQRQDRLHWSAQPERWDRSPRDRRADVSAEGRSDLRVADADRAAVIDDLRRHTGDGRLTLLFGGCGRHAVPPAAAERVDDRDDSVTYA